MEKPTSQWTIRNTDNNATSTSLQTAQILCIIPTPKTECSANPTKRNSLKQTFSK
jgi:hypothetical protein